MKTTRHSLMAKGILVLLSLLIIVFIITFAWFGISQPDSEAHGVSMKTKSGSDFEYAIGFQTSQTFGEYLVTDFTNRNETELDIEDLNVPGKYDGSTPISYNLLYDYTPIDVTGDGATLIRPAMDYGNWKINTGTDDYSIAEANTQYISFDLIIRSKAACTLYLGPNSFAYGESEVDSNNKPLPDGSKLTGSGVARKSDYGNFSRDAIVGATRVAFLGFDNSLTAASYTTGLQNEYLNSTPSALWVTRPDLYLNNNNGQDTTTTDWSLTTGVTSSQAFNHSSQSLGTVSGYSTYQHQQYDIFNNYNKNIVTNNQSYVHISSLNTDTNDYRLNDTVELIPINKPMTVREGNEDVTYYYGKVRCRIWVEGTDTEARRALSKGRFKLNFDLTTNSQ